MPYLICQSCGGYYELEEDESPQDFDRCRCGGELIYTEHLYNKPDKPKGNGKKLFTLLLIFLALVIIVGSFIALSMPPVGNNSGSSSLLGSDYRGTVTKEVLAASDSTSSDKKTIAVITGMHPREKLSIETVSDVVNQYSLSANEEIIHYSVNVTNNPNNYYTGRSSGEGLVARYIVPDVKKSNVDVVIICHDHAPGYGRGYYIATPKMDSVSVVLGEKIEKDLSEFTYYRSTANAEHGSSTLTVSYPLASNGTGTLVYEMPEWATYTRAYHESKKLISTCFQGI
ncbi:hypothetical protein [Methanobacterium petrolearium]|uniref:hypothetical protein n=1 Tax=Methanobacterium petrolearium TaxID=710190 RepID=UPI001AE41C76|nr:hypothetical protein [Methanobacterium petrolearium]MBP1946266.1 hypothetical protein [Methanobacterium petrolearium]BDZ71357.1 hypothetical protein GCM10025861_18740 [Methanobacterium petrolearium]